VAKRPHLLLAAILLGCNAAPSHAAFDTVINADRVYHEVPTSIDSNTQLNISEKGRIPDDFQAGNSNGLSRDVEVNVSGGRVGDNYQAYAGSTTNISGGSFPDYLEAFDGSTINISGEGKARLRAKAGSIINVSGGVVLTNSGAEKGSTLNITGGLLLSPFSAQSGSTINISGGNHPFFYRISRGSQFNLYGAEFFIDDQPVDGLSSVGDHVAVDISNGRILSGTLEDGTPFVFNSPIGNLISADTVTLWSATVPQVAFQPVEIRSATSHAGARGGEKVVVAEGGDILGGFTAAIGSTLDISGGDGGSVSAIGSTITLSGGRIPFLRTQQSTLVEASGGTIGHSARMHSASVMKLSGAVIEKSFHVFSGSRVDMTSGSIGELFSLSEAMLEMRGGSIGDLFNVYGGSRAVLSGGTLGNGFHAHPNSYIELRGTNFSVDGELLADLEVGQSVVVSARDVELTGQFADGSAFEFDLNSRDYDVYFDSRDFDLFTYSDYFASDATLTLTLVPEPAAFSLGFFALLLLATRRQCDDNSDREP